jgi:hypothetical protein
LTSPHVLISNRLHSLKVADGIQHAIAAGVPARINISVKLNAMLEAIVMIACVLV